MDVTELPFNQLLGMQRTGAVDQPGVGLPADARYTNHLGTVHAGALLAVAEAASGDYLLAKLGDAEGFLPVVRRIDCKFRRPATGAVAGTCEIDAEALERSAADLKTKGRAIITVPTRVLDEGGQVVLQGTVEWFVTAVDGTRSK